MSKTALIIGNSDGIGLGLTQSLLSGGWSITGISRSDSEVRHPQYRHIVSEVQSNTYPEALKSTLENQVFELCVYCTGIGELLDFSNMKKEIEVIEVNLTGLVTTLAEVLPHMLDHGKGHIIGISSFADELRSGKGASYHASKAGFSSYLESLTLALRDSPVSITNIRFGFVDTKMAKGDRKPFMMTVDKAVHHIKKCIEKRPVRYSAPRIAIPFVKLHKLLS